MQFSDGYAFGVIKRGIMNKLLHKAPIMSKHAHVIILGCE